MPKQQQQQQQQWCRSFFKQRCNNLQWLRCEHRNSQQ
jgi:hypothetical protein